MNAEIEQLECLVEAIDNWVRTHASTFTDSANETRQALLCDKAEACRRLEEMEA